jgi:hypothetical protein
LKERVINMKEIVVDKNLIAFCGLYCGACGQYLRGKCTGCAKNEKATWCSIRKCNNEHSWKSCAECTVVGNVIECGKFNNLMSKIFGFIFRSDRKACIDKIKAVGYDQYAVEMAAVGKPSMHR